MSTPKEGPPTLRECKKILQHAKDQLDIDWGTTAAVPAQERVNDILIRLIDETLERDEKSRAALENAIYAAKNVSEGYKVISPIRDGMGSPVLESVELEWVGEHDEVDAMMGLKEALDALTPAPKEKEVSG